MTDEFSFNLCLGKILFLFGRKKVKEIPFQTKHQNIIFLWRILILLCREIYNLENEECFINIYTVKSE